MVKRLLFVLFILSLCYLFLSFSSEKSILGRVISIDSSYENIKWLNMPLTYYINYSSCGELMKTRIKNAFLILENESEGKVEFHEGDFKSDILITCTSKINFIKGFYESGEATYYSEGENINRAEIVFYNVNPKANNKFAGGCTGYPNLELHEILHVLDFSHKSGNSIMNPLIDGCKIKEVDRDIIEKIKEIYS
ncbi:MAG: hypothetical protein WC867_00745 [Candidatus Pacearchaeota archaeon]|jgi:hypothetical protein